MPAGTPKHPPASLRLSPGGAQAALSSPSLIPDWHFVLQWVQLSPVSDPAPRAHTLPHCGNPPGVFLWQHSGFVVQEPLGLEVCRDEGYLGGKERQSPGAVLGITGTLSPHSGKRARVSLQLGLGSFPTIFGCLPWKWLF